MNKISTSQKNIKTVNAKMNEENDNANEFPYEPGKGIINSILNYSKSLKVMKSSAGETFEMMLN